MRVSVVIPTYNSAGLVPDAVRSVLAQTRPAEEVIVVDDGSTDDTAQRLASFGDRVKVIVKPNGGVASARNRGVREATGDAIAFLDADDVWHPRKLEIQAAVLEEHSDLAILGTDCFDWPSDAMPDPCLSRPEVTPISFNRLIVRNKFDTSTVVVLRAALLAAGEFDETLHGPEDWDMWLQVLQKAKGGYIDRRLTGYRRTTPNSLSKNAERMEQDTLRIIERYKNTGAFADRYLLLRRAIANNAIRSAYMYVAGGKNSQAISRIVHSYLHWPFPFKSEDGNVPFVRLRLLTASVRRMMRLSRTAEQ
jgi:glycosyltransferase involved in cell wall biosynthesis